MARQMQLPLDGITSAGRQAKPQARCPVASTDRRERSSDPDERKRHGGPRSRSGSSYFRYGGPEDWRVDEHTRAAGRRGLAAARAALARVGMSGDGSGSTENAA